MILIAICVLGGRQILQKTHWHHYDYFDKVAICCHTEGNGIILEVSVKTE